jgi:hypothetical protein
VQSPTSNSSDISAKGSEAVALRYTVLSHVVVAQLAFELHGLKPRLMFEGKGLVESSRFRALWVNRVQLAPPHHVLSSLCTLKECLTYSMDTTMASQYRPAQA